jgi:hypothetical protein
VSGPDPERSDRTSPFAFFLRFFAFFAFHLTCFRRQRDASLFHRVATQGKREKRKEPQKERKGFRGGSSIVQQYFIERIGHAPTQLRSVSFSKPHNRSNIASAPAP